MDLCECGKGKDYRSKKCKFCAKRIGYTKEEDRIIINLFPTKSSYEISKLIKRSHSSIRHRAVSLGLTNNKEFNSYKYSKYSGMKGVKGKDHPAWKKGRISQHGYVLIHSPKHPFRDRGGYVAEHRLIVEDKIRRHLKSKEVVHHINEKRDDNRIENLMLFSSNGEHISFHRKIQQFGMTNPIRRQIKERWNKN